MSCSRSLSSLSIAYCTFVVAFCMLPYVILFPSQEISTSYVSQMSFTQEALSTVTLSPVLGELSNLALALARHARTSPSSSTFFCRAFTTSE